MKLVIKAKKEGFRRCGRAWSVNETIVDTDSDNFTAEQIAVLKNDPDLVVVEASGDVTPKDTKATQAEIDAAVDKALAEAQKQHQADIEKVREDAKAEQEKAVEQAVKEATKEAPKKASKPAK